jgi:hypothetical protein
MVHIKLDEVFLEKETVFSDFDIMREYRGVDPLNFILFSMRHPNEYPRAQRYIEICNDDFRSELCKWLNRMHGFEWENGLSKGVIRPVLRVRETMY